MSKIRQYWRTKLHVARGIAHLLGRRRICQLLLLFLLMCICSFGEMAGVGSVFPVISILSNPDGFQASRLGMFIGNIFPGVEMTTLIWYLIFIFIGLNFVINVLMAVIIYCQYRFVASLQHFMSTNVLKKYLSKDYEFFLSRNTAVLVKNLSASISIFCTLVLLPLLNLMLHLILCVAIVTLLLLVNVQATIFILGFFSIVFGFMFRFSQKRVKSYGDRREELMADLNKVAYQAFSGVKLAKTHGLENTLFVEYSKVSKAYNNINVRAQAMYTVPPYVAKVLVMLFLGGVMAYFLLAEYPISSLLPFFTLYFLGGLRLLNPANVVFASWSQMQYGISSIESLSDALEGGLCHDEDHHAPEVPDTLGPIETIEFRDVSYRYPNRDELVIKNLDFSISRGQRVGFVGTSGCGKTTTIDILLGLLKPADGGVYINGQCLDDTNCPIWHHHIGYVPQQVFLVDGSLQDNIEIGIPPESRNPQLLREVIRMAHLDGLLERMPNGIETSLGENGVCLSGGERQRVGIARALYRKPNVLILDEATSALDAVTEEKILQEALGLSHDITIITITHRLMSLRAYDRLYLLDDGVLQAYGTYDQLEETNPLFAILASKNKEFLTLENNSQEEPS
ncbi:MAG: ABC transporter ATP-binding protein/permease [Phycisphaerae bacterium]|nr:ABC transporter ATP-binding protein/permease [Phycisphaerae bacterium]